MGLLGWCQRLGDALARGGPCSDPSKFGLITAVIETSYAILSVNEVVILDEAEASVLSMVQYCSTAEILPFAMRRRRVNDGLAGIDSAKSLAVCEEHLICGIRLKSTDVDIGLAIAIVKNLVQRSSASIGSTSQRRHWLGDLRFAEHDFPKVHHTRFALWILPNVRVIRMAS